MVMRLLSSQQTRTAVLFVAVVAAVVDAVASSRERQTHAIIEAAELPRRRTLEFN